jgi:ketosteroid isomerase-like protein
LNILWSDDAVNLVFPGPAVVGKKAMQQAFEKFRAEHPDFEVLKYAPDIKDVQVADGWAIEVGYTEATYKMSAKDNPVSVPRTQGMRLLKRQSDGSWKFARVAGFN